MNEQQQYSEQDLAVLAAVLSPESIPCSCLSILHWGVSATENGLSFQASARTPPRETWRLLALACLFFPATSSSRAVSPLWLLVSVSTYSWLLAGE